MSGSSFQALLDKSFSKADKNKNSDREVKKPVQRKEPDLKNRFYNEIPENWTSPTGFVSNFNFAPLGKKLADTKNKLLKEISLVEMGYSYNKVDGWEKIIQKRQDNLAFLLKTMIENFIKTNVIIQIGEKSFNCHMMVLQCYSSFFMSLGTEQVICLPADKVSSEAFAMIYDWMLTPEPKVQREGILQLFIAAQFLKIQALIDQCWVCLDDDKRFCEDAAFLLYLEARSLKLDLISDLMLSRISKFFIILVASKEFVELDYEQVCKLLKSNSIAVNSEAEVSGFLLC